MHQQPCPVHIALDFSITVSTRPGCRVLWRNFQPLRPWTAAMASTSRGMEERCVTYDGVDPKEAGDTLGAKQASKISRLLPGPGTAPALVRVLHEDVLKYINPRPPHCLLVFTFPEKSEPAEQIAGILHRILAESQKSPGRFCRLPELPLHDTRVVLTLFTSLTHSARFCHSLLDRLLRSRCSNALLPQKTGRARPSRPRSDRFAMKQSRRCSRSWTAQKWEGT